MAISRGKLNYFHRKVEETLDVVHCHLTILVEKSYKKAVYSFSYKVKKRSEGDYTDDDLWFGVIPYAEKHVSQFQCSNPAGARTERQSLPDGRTIFIIPFSKRLNVEEEYEFSYSYRTKIESIVENRMFRTSGNISYYISHVSPCYHLHISLSFEGKKPRIIRLHPDATEQGEASIDFEKQNVSPLDFYVFNCLYESGLPKRIAYTLEHLIWITVGVALTLLADAFTNGS